MKSYWIEHHEVPTEYDVWKCYPVRKYGWYVVVEWNKIEQPSIGALIQDYLDSDKYLPQFLGITKVGKNEFYAFGEQENDTLC